MKRIPIFKLRWLLLALPPLLSAGCVAPDAGLQVCPGKANVEEALATLAAQAEKAIPFRISSGECLLTYHVPDERKAKRHNLFLKLWFNPPWEVYVQASIAADPKAVIVGSNEERFWLSLRPQEVSSYYEGQWSQVRDFDGLMMSPRVMLEAFGVVVSADEASQAQAWSLKNKGAFDILTRHDDSGRPTRRIYIYACDYHVRKIEYLDEAGQIRAVTRMADYEPVTEDFAIPRRIKATLTGPDKRTDSMEIKLGAAKSKEFTQALRDYMLVQRDRDRDRAENVYEYVDGQWVPKY